MKRRDFTTLLTLSAMAMPIGNLKSLENWSQTLQGSSLTPSLFIGHGSPMNAIEENEFVQGFRTAAAKLPEIQAILVISAHWLTNGTAVTAMKKPKTIHDFGGFPTELFAQQYPAPGSPTLAQEIKDLMHETPVLLDNDWGLDHGTWTVLKHLYPEAKIPVVQFSIDYKQPLSYHFELAQALQALRKKAYSLSVLAISFITCALLILVKSMKLAMGTNGHTKRGLLSISQLELEISKHL